MRITDEASPHCGRVIKVTGVSDTTLQGFVDTDATSFWTKKIVGNVWAKKTDVTAMLEIAKPHSPPWKSLKMTDAERAEIEQI